ncbi:gliding motility-associated C-terminal domain-containing protein [Flagellimonas onchidii]|uniref:gliding motility-associated C-terminal domain-containing protein n=1 Tax=Flagellimonas onchidii TaxID=2562684 RepID=UPI0010A64C2F|nr:gliding motility-associated C-terminal domain-containing protein [Allomuricauda onchidii]
MLRYIYLGLSFYKFQTFKAFIAFFTFLLSNISIVQSQCAGGDNTIDVCDKYSDLSNRTFNLFNILSGAPQPGGIWSTTNSLNLNALNTNTGIVDLWKINRFGEHLFIYTNEACGESASVTLQLGGYAGEDNIDGSANACNGNPKVNLFNFIGSPEPDVVPDSNGLWIGDPMGNAPPQETLNGNLFNAELADIGEYDFIYMVPNVGSCQGYSSKVKLEVHPKANSGEPIDIVVCTTDDLSSFTNLDLATRLVNEDPFGIWSENGTGQIDNEMDHFINVQEINQNFGYGEYGFHYTVFPTNPVCPIAMTEVLITILPVLDGNIDIPNYCLEEEYLVTLNYDQSILPDGLYELVYSINSTLGVQQINTDIDLINGLGMFIIPSSSVPVNEPIEIDIIGIQGTMPEQDVCNNVLVQSKTFMVSDPTIPDDNYLSANELFLCRLDNPTVNELKDLENVIDQQIEWFDTAEGGEPLSVQNLLKDNATYYAQIYLESECIIDPERTPVTVDLGHCNPEDYDFYIPDGFSPNNDGRNDTFFIPNIEKIFPDFTLEIFNRYGNSLFKGNIDNPAWNGSKNGKNIAPNGVYFYIVRFNKTGYNPKQGRLYLNR